MHSLLPPARPDHGWAEAYFSKWGKERVVKGSRSDLQTPRDDAPGACTPVVYDHPWKNPDHITVYEPDWKNQTRIDKFSHRDHSTWHDHFNSWTNTTHRTYSGGHNWYMTTRFDVWFYYPDEPFRWHGSLITGGDNGTFRIRRTTECDLHFGPFPWAGRPSEYLTCARPGGRLADAPDIWLLDTRYKWLPQVFAMKVGNQWLASDSLADLVTRRIHGQRLAA